MNKRIDKALKVLQPQNFKIKHIVSVFPVFSAIALGVFKDNIIPGISNVGKILMSKEEHFSSYNPEWVTIIYLIIVIIWIVFYWVFVLNEKTSNEKNTETLHGAILRAPNPMVYPKYQDKFKEMARVLSEIDGTFESYNTQFLSVMESIRILTGDFMRQEKQTFQYGANIMIYLSSKSNSKYFEQLREYEDHWLHFRDVDFNKIDGVLYLVSKLSCRMHKKDSVEVPSISIAVKHSKNRAELGTINVPGAPYAAIWGNYFFKNVRAADNYTHLGATEQKIANEFWKYTNDIESILSVSIPYNWKGEENLDIVGVLNIDGKKTSLLGTAPDYNQTFNALMLPIATIIGPHLKNYIEKFAHEIIEKDLEERKKKKKTENSLIKSIVDRSFRSNLEIWEI